MGIVLSSVCFWHGEWTGLTIIADIRSILVELIEPPIRISEHLGAIRNHLIVGKSTFSN